MSGATRTTRLGIARLHEMAVAACRACGASEAVAHSLADATLAADRAGKPSVGFAHLPDYLASLREGRIAGKAEPEIGSPLPAFIHADAKGGIAQLGFDRAFDDLVSRAKTLGIAIFTQANCYTAGELGYYPRRLAEEGLLALAFTNAHAMVAPGNGARKPVYGTNPLAFACPLPPPHAPLVIDQSSSATAFVNLLQAEREGRSIPGDWAIDRNGQPTTDAREAIDGALLAFGGARGGNVALMVEMLSAGLSGGRWSLDAGHFRQGADCPNIGLTIIAIAPRSADPSTAERASAQLDRLARVGVYIPGRAARAGVARDDEELEIDTDVLAAICQTIA